MAKKAINKTAKKPAAAKKIVKATKAQKGKKKTELVKVSFHSVVAFVRMLHGKDHADAFFDAAKAGKAKLVLDRRSAKLVKEYFAKQQGAALKAAVPLDPCPGADPFDCKKFRS